MILQIDCNDRRVMVELEDPTGLRRVTVDGKEVQYDCTRLPNGHYSMIVGGRVFDFIVDLTNGNGSVTARGGSYALKVADTRRLLAKREVEEGRSGLQRLTADMPGKVVRVLVREGESVAYDQGLLVLEAMKMQNEIRAPKSGIIREIGAAEGRAVSTGEFLLSLE